MLWGNPRNRSTPKPLNPMKNRYLWVFVLCIAPGLLFGLTADELTKKTGIEGGLCSFPQATQEDMKLALELAKRPTFVVHVMAKKEEEVASICAAGSAMARSYASVSNFNRNIPCSITAGT